MRLPLFDFDKNISVSKNADLIAGVDEVGRGPLAGPLVVSAVVLDLNRINDIVLRDKRDNYKDNIVNELIYYSMINDSKKLTPKLRDILSKFIKSEAISYSVTEIPNNIIDSIGITASTQKAFFKAVSKLKVKPQYIITDSFRINKIIAEAQTNIVRGDCASISIASASIVAKVHRDGLMRKYHKKYPLYAFDKHKGYGTKQHIEAINTFGLCDIHRKSFEPVKTWIREHAS